MKDSRLRFGVLAAVAIVLALASASACSRVGSLLRKATPTPAPATVKVALAPFLSNSIIQIGIEEGFFAEQGLTLETVDVKGADETLALLAVGDIDAGAPAIGAALFNAVAAGSDMRVVLPLSVHIVQDCATIGLVARKEDIDSGRFAGPATWKDARVITQQTGFSGTGGYYMSRAFAEVGLTIADVHLEKSNSAVFEEALRSNQVDIAFTAEPWITRILAAGDMALLTGLERYSGGMQAASLVLSGRMVKNTDVCMRFVLACLKAVRQYAQGPTPRNVEILSAFTELEPDLVAKMCWAYAPTDGRMDPAPIRDYQLWMKDQGLIDRVLEPQEYLDTRFVEAAVRTLDGSGE